MGFRSLVLNLPIVAKTWSGIAIILVISSFAGLAGVSGVDRLTKLVQSSGEAASVLAHVNAATQDVNRFIVGEDGVSLDDAISSLETALGLITSESFRNSTAGQEELSGIIIAFKEAIGSLGQATAVIRDARKQQEGLNANLLATATTLRSSAEAVYGQALAAATDAKANSEKLQDLILTNGAITGAVARGQLLLRDAGEGRAEAVSQFKATSSVIGTQSLLSNETARRLSKMTFSQ